MSAAASTVPGATGARTYPGALSVARTDKLDEAKIRRRMGLARVRVRATCEDQGHAIGLTHVAIVDRRHGKGPDALLALEIVAYERAHINTDSIINELRAVQLAARFAELHDEDILRRLGQAIAEEHALEGRENAATCRFIASGCFATLIEGMAPETDLQTEIRALAMVADERGLAWRAS
jgi:hypothetical protein